MNPITSYTRARVANTTINIDGALTRINQLAPREMTADEVAVFRGVVSRRAVDSYGTIMETSTLRNYADGYGQGLPLLDSHNQRSLPIGRSYEAAFRDVPTERNELGDPMQEVSVSYYIQRGVKLQNGQSTDDLIRLIEGGTIRDLSVGFDYSIGSCSICGKNQLDPKGGCRHAVLAEYDGKTCYQRIMNGKPMESSLVWAASCPNSYIERAKQLYSDGALSAAQLHQLEDTYHEIILPRYSVAGPNQQRSTTVMNELQTMLANVLTRSSLGADAKAKLQAAISQLEAGDTAYSAAETILLDMVTATKEEAATEANLETARVKKEVATRAGEVASLASELTNVRMIIGALGEDASPDAVSRLKAEAVDGRAYRAAKIAQVRQAYTVATGRDANKLARTFDTASIEELEEMQASWDAQARAAFADEQGTVGKRQTETPIELKKTTATPADAYRLGPRR